MQAVLNMLPTMAHAQFLTLFALIQYGSAEIASNSPGGSWFAANVISDSDFSPKPLTEIFTTERAFLSTNPIVVLPSSTASAIVTTVTSMGTQETSTQSTVSAPPTTSDNPAPISTSTITTTSDFSTVTQATTQTDTAASVQTDPPASSVSPSSQSPSQPQQNFFYIYPQGTGALQPQAQAQLQTASTTVAPCVTATSASPQTGTAPQPTTTVGSVPMSTTQNTTRPFPTIRIRMLSPNGSITNINFVRGLTTAKPNTTTRRNRRRNRNNFDDCVDACVGRRTPICATVAGRSISENTLKGFPTMCHLGCNNSFRKNAYKKVADGRCGRLRRRIMNMNQPGRNQFTILANPGSFVGFQPGLNIITSNNI